MDATGANAQVVYLRCTTTPRCPARQTPATQLGPRGLWAASVALAAVVVVSSLGCGESETRDATPANKPTQKTETVATPAETQEQQAATSGDASQEELLDAAPEVAEAVTPEAVREPSLANEGQAAAEPTPTPPPKLPEPKGAKRLSPDFDIWVDKQQKAVIIDGVVSQRRAILEMFACTPNTKEHESIIQANTQAFLAHTGLLAIGAEPGHPVRWDPEYEPPTGTEIEIEVHWRDKQGKPQSAPAQKWVRKVSSGEEMAEPWVFGGSGLWKDEQTGKEYYMAEGGDFICVSNFGSAMLDVPAPSTQANDGLLYEAFTERIPPLGTPVRMFLRPKLGDDEAGQEPQ